MTYKSGFEVGLGIGFVAFLFLNGNIQITQFQIPARVLVAFLAVLVFPIISFVVGVGTVMEGHAIFGTSWDGFIYGFTTALDIPYIFYLVVQFLNGNLPLPWQP
jgi:hypothetical protein